MTYSMVINTLWYSVSMCDFN